jgi:hypothetical protein
VPRKNLHSEIAKVAYEIFMKSGYSHGYDLDHWLEAERIVLLNQSAKIIKKEKISKTAKKDPTKNGIKSTIKKTIQKKKPAKNKNVVKKVKKASPTLNQPGTA